MYPYFYQSAFATSVLMMLVVQSYAMTRQLLLNVEPSAVATVKTRHFSLWVFIELVFRCDTRGRTCPKV